MGALIDLFELVLGGEIVFEFLQVVAGGHARYLPEYPIEGNGALEARRIGDIGKGVKITGDDFFTGFADAYLI